MLNAPLTDIHLVELGSRTERTIRAELEGLLAGTGVTQDDRCRSRQALMLLTEDVASGRDARRQGCAEPTTRHRRAREGPRSDRPLPRAEL